MNDHPSLTAGNGHDRKKILLITPENPEIRRVRKRQFNNFTQITMPYLAGFIDEGLFPRRTCSIISSSTSATNGPCEHRPIMKQLLQIAAVLSFLFPFVCGVCLLGAGLFSNNSEAYVPLVIGSFLVGNAFFVGAILLFAAEKLGRNAGSK